MIHISQHAYNRSKERGLGKGRRVEQNAVKAFYFGKNPEETNSKLCKYLNHLLSISKNGDSIKIFGNEIYIFQGNCLITTFSIPQKFIQPKRK